MKDNQRIWGFLAHASIIVGMMFVVFFVMDWFNPAMEFLSSSLSIWLILILAMCAIFTGLYSVVFLFRKQKKRDEKRIHLQARPAYAGENVPQERFAQTNFDARAYPQGRQSQGYQRYYDELSKLEYERGDLLKR